LQAIGLVIDDEAELFDVAQWRVAVSCTVGQSGKLLPGGVAIIVVGCNREMKAPIVVESVADRLGDESVDEVNTGGVTKLLVVEG
jgi:hypothetical protein